MLFGYEDDGQLSRAFEYGHMAARSISTKYAVSRSQQKAILKMLLDGGVTRIGGKDLVQMTLRILSSCSGDPKKRISEGVLREDLYHRPVVTWKCRG